MNIIAKDQLQESARLRPADFVLNPEDFLKKCHQAFPSPVLLPDSPESKALLRALQQGISKLEIVEAFRFAHQHAAPLISSDRDEQVRDHLASHPTINDIIALAPEDDKLFIDLAFGLLFRAAAPQVDRLAAYAHLKSGAHDRKSVLHWLLAHSADRAPHLRGQDAPIQHDIIFARPLPQSIEIGIDAHMWLQKPPVPPQSAVIEPGWILAGPKRDLLPGRWVLEVQLWQPFGARVAVDVVANGGLKSYVSFELDGPASMMVSFQVLPSDQLVEARLFKPQQHEDLCHLGLTRLTLKPTIDKPERT